MEHSKRPVYLNLLKIQFPVTAVVSMLHRISGFMLFLAIPFLIYCLHISTASATGLDTIKAWFATYFAKLVIFILIWAGLHHLFAGLRYLLMDLDIGLKKAHARLSAMLVLALVFVGLLIWVVR